MADSTISNLPPSTGAPLTVDDLLVVAQEQAIPDTYITIKAPIGDLITPLAPLVAAAIGGDYVQVAGDTMTGNLAFDNSGATESWLISTDTANGLTISGSTYDQILALNPGTDAVGNTGQTITGRFRYSAPIIVQNTAAVLGSGSTGVTTGLVRCSSATPVTLDIRANTGAPVDFSAGNFFSVVQEGAGKVTLEPETGDVVLHIPAGKIAATRDQYSTITATYYIAGATQYWLISGDLDDAA